MDRFDAIEDLEKFARTIDHPTTSGVLGRAMRTPPRKMVHDVVRKFDSGTPVTSPSGLSAEIAMKWARRTGTPFVLGWSAALDAFVVIKASEKQVDDLADVSP